MAISTFEACSNRRPRGDSIIHHYRVVCGDQIARVFPRLISWVIDHTVSPQRLRRKRSQGLKMILSAVNPMIRMTNIMAAT